MSTEKGAALAVISVMATIFILTGAMFIGIVAENEIKKTANYSTDHVNKLMEAKIKKPVYEANLRKEIEYSHNNIAYETGKNGGQLDWDNNIPSRDKIRNELHRQFFEHEYNLKDQNRLIGCTKPLIERDNLTVEGDNTIKLDFSGASIACHGGDSKAILPIEKTFTVENDENNFVPMAFHARELAEKVAEELPSNAEGEIDFETGCKVNEQVQEEAAKESAIEEVVKDALDSKEVAENVFQDIDNPDYITLQNSETTVELDREPNVERDSTDCSGGEVKYSVQGEFEVQEVHASFALQDSENQVPTHEGMENLVFDFTYKHGLE